MKLDPDHSDARVGLKKGPRFIYYRYCCFILGFISNVLLRRLAEEKEKGNAAFRAGNYEEALGYYTKVGDNTKIHFLKF